MVVIATPSDGAGPFGDPIVDTGPYALTWGLDDRLYVGNVEGQGDLVRADLGDGSVTPIHTLPDRIHAAVSYDATSLLVAIEGGDVHRVHTDLELSEPWASLGEDVLSLVRDPFTGRIYATVASGRIVELDAGGTELGDLDDLDTPGRAAIAPDGFLYFLVPGYPGPGSITRYALPDTL
jgi:hypothetical protein